MKVYVLTETTKYNDDYKSEIIGVYSNYDSVSNKLYGKIEEYKGIFQKEQILRTFARFFDNNGNYILISFIEKELDV